MKHNKLTALILATALVLSLLCGCTAATQVQAPAQSGTEAAAPVQTPQESEQPVEEAADTSVTVTDMMGREVTIAEPATRIVALTAADCEILCALGAGDLLVGRGEFCDYPAEVLEIPAVQSGNETNLEQIISLAPQVVLMGTMNQTIEQQDKLADAGIATVVSEATDIEGVYSSIAVIGALLGKDAEAAALIDGMKATFDGIRSEDAGKTVYFEVSPLEYGLWTAGDGTFMNEIAGMLGLENCFADVTGWAEISEEQVLTRNPDYIVTISIYFGEGPTPEEEIAARPGWSELTAVKNGDILNLRNNELSRPGPRLAEGAQAMYDFINAD